MQQYMKLMRHVLRHGNKKSDRTGTGTRSVFGYQMRFDLQKGFPLVTTKKIHVKSVIHELLWFISGSTNIKYLNDNGVHIWDQWACADGSLGPTYGHQWRHAGAYYPALPFEGLDQILNVVHFIKKEPDSRRLIVCSWDAAEVAYMRLPPCHCLFQFYVNDGKLSCQLYQRSADIFLGVPFNIASYALLTHMIAQQTGLDVGEFIWTGGDCHLYENHIEQAKEQLTRQPYPLPKLVIKRKPESIFDYKYEDFEIVNYQSHPHIKAEVAI